MPLRNTQRSYGSISKFFHWLIAILVIFMLIYGFSLNFVPKAYVPITFNIHKLIGLTILTLIILRLLWTLTNPKPELPPNTPWYEHVAEYVVHWSFYLLLIAMPLSGWVFSVAAGRPPKLGSYAFNLPIEQNKSLSEAVFNVHAILALIIIALLILHVAAALYHHYVHKDNVLRRMLPFV
jgi:cytochrome b561